MKVLIFSFYLILVIIPKIFSQVIILPDSNKSVYLNANSKANERLSQLLNSEFKRLEQSIIPDDYMLKALFNINSEGKVSEIRYDIIKVLDISQSIKGISNIENQAYCKEIEAVLSEVAKKFKANEIQNAKIRASYFYRKAENPLDFDAFVASIKEPLEIKTLDFSNRGIRNISRKIKVFKNLESLNLDGNNLANVKIKGLKKLKVINLSNNILAAKSIKLRKLPKLNILTINNNNLEAIPKTLYKTKQLSELSLANNFIENIDKVNFTKLQNLKLLNLYRNNITQIPKSIFKLQSLQSLDLYHNNIRFLPAEIGDIKQLETLAISNNDIWELPQSISKLTNLKTLLAHHNKIQNIQELPLNIENLSLDNNLIENVPKCLSKLDKLTELDIANNKIMDGWAVLLSISNLKKLFISGNAFRFETKNNQKFQVVIEKLVSNGVEVK